MVHETDSRYGMVGRTDFKLRVDECSHATDPGFKCNTLATMNMFEALFARQKQEAEDKIYFSSATSLSGT